MGSAGDGLPSSKRGGPIAASHCSYRPTSVPVSRNVTWQGHPAIPSPSSPPVLTAVRRQGEARASSADGRAVGHVGNEATPTSPFGLGAQQLMAQGITIGQQYDALRQPGRSRLRLNLSVAEQEEAGGAVRGPGPQGLANTIRTTWRIEPIHRLCDRRPGPSADRRRAAAWRLEASRLPLGSSNASCRELLPRGP
jgi:hypothetical protein